MASLISKRQQARNEKALQVLISSVPGNERCADCSAKNPGWASWSLGIFLCMRCAALHRKLGTHISKVKSLSMDSWNTEQVETMKRVGNTTSNRTFNPNNVKPQIPIDVDEADGVMERFIRHKYEQRAFVSGTRPVQVRPTSASSDDQPGPPLPPKPGKKFGFGLRSTSSATTKQERPTPPLSPAYTGSNGSSSPQRANKQSRVLGSNVGNQEADFDAKLAALRDMGFKDNRRNSTILKTLNGNLDRTVEALVRIGETSKPPSGTITPVSAGSGANGITVEKRRPAAEASRMNPFDALDLQPPQRSATMPPQLMQDPPTQPAFYAGPTNMLQAQQQAYQQQPISLQDQMQALNLSQPQSQPQPQQSFHSNPFLPQQSQPATSPGFGMQPMQPNAFAPSMLSPAATGSSNPFLRRVQSQTFAQSNPWGQSPVGSQMQSPLTSPWQAFQSQVLASPPVQSPAGYPHAHSPFANPQQNGYFAPASTASPAYQPPTSPFQPQQMNNMQSFPPSNPYQQASAPPSQMPLSPQPPGMQQYGQPQPQPMQPVQEQPWQYVPHQQQSQAQQGPRHDKSSILALYSQPQASPAPQHPAQQDMYAQGTQVQQRSATMPVGHMNPFGGQQGPVSGVGYPQGQGGGQADAYGQQQANAGAQQQDAFSGLMPQRWQ